MRMRTTAILAALFAVALWAAPAQAKLVYVKHAGSVSPVVYVAKDNGKEPRRLGIGRAPTISPNGQWVAFVTVPAGGSAMDTVVLQKLEAGSQRLVMRSKSIDSLRFSPDSTKLGAIAGGKRVRVYDIPTDAAARRRGGPDARVLVLARQQADRLRPGGEGGLPSDSDLYVVPALGGQEKRLTTLKNALNPVWGPKEIVFDRFGVAPQRRARVQPLGARPRGAGHAPPAHQAEDPAAGERPGAARDLGGLQAAAGGLHRPGRPGRASRS